MALYLNFYHEVQKQKLQRQRDPLKIGIMILLVIAMGFIAYYFWRLEAVQKAKNELVRVSNDWKTAEPKEKAALVRKDELDQMQKLADSLAHKVENRFYWAPLLEHILQVVPSNIQITGLDATVSNAGQKRVTLVVSGISSGIQPRTAAEDLRTTFQTKLSANYQQVTAIFRSLEDSTETVQLGGKNLPTSVFTIDVTLMTPDIAETAKGSEKPVRGPKL